MGIRTKTLLIMSITALLLLAGLYVSSRAILLTSALKEERTITGQYVEHMNNILKSDKAEMNTMSADWAHWDDTCRFIENRDEGYIKSNLTNETLANLKLNFVLFVDKNGRLTYNKALDLIKEVQVETPRSVIDIIQKGSPILDHPDPNSVISGFILLPEGPALVSSLPILHSDKSGPVNGTLIFGRFFDSGEMMNIKWLEDLSITYENVANTGMPADFKKAYQLLDSGTEEYVTPLDSDHIAGYSLIKDINGKPAFIIKMETSRKFLEESLHNINFFIIAFLVCVIVLFAVCVIILQRVVISRLENLSRFISETSASRDTSMRIDIPGNDEISILAYDTSKMLEEMEKAQKQLEYLGYNDKLTGLRNRTYFEGELEKADSIDSLPITIIMADVNGLKIINDTLGHQEGDRLLCVIARIFKDCCGENSVIARLGGDEFSVILYDRGESASMQICNNIKHSCEANTEFLIKPNLALGAATKSVPAQNLLQILKEAEERMFRNKLLESGSTRNSIISSLEQTLGERSNETEEHTCRIREMCIQLGHAINLTNDELDELILLGTLHDIGKVGIPDYILMKPDKLTPDEWEIMKHHSEIGYRIALATPELGHIALEILAHHERYDGTGYPQGLKAEQIPLLSRVLSIVDAYDVMTHPRLYKEAIMPLEAMQELKSCSGTQFDPKLTDIFITMLFGK